MQDESLIDEMRTALRGDRERAEIRRRSPQAAPAAAAPEADPGKTAVRRGPLAVIARLRRRS